jgi:hypothetical protein
VTPPGVERLRAALEALDADLARACWRADAGLGPAADLPAAFAAHPQATGPDAAELARELAGDDALRPLAAWAARLLGRRAGAEAEARARAWRAAARVRVPGGATVAYGDVADALADASGDRAARLALDAARGEAAGGAYAPLLRERWARERDAVEALGLGGAYLDAWARLEGADPRAAAAAAATFLRETESAWRDALADRVRRQLGVAPSALPGGLRRADEPALLADATLDGLLPAGGALAAARTQAAAMGLDAAAGGRVRVDAGARAGQRPGAWSVVVRVPWEAYLSARPRGGVAGWRALLGALGGALAAAGVSPDLPAEARVHGTRTLRATVARLWAGLAGDEGWLRRYADLDRERAAAVRRQAGFAALLGARREAALCVLAVDVLDGAVPEAEAADAGVAALAAATGARVATADVTGHLTPWLGAATALGATLQAAPLDAGLRERFDEDWWRNPRAGPWLATAVLAGDAPAAAGPAAPADAARAAERALA